MSRLKRLFEQQRHHWTFLFLFYVLSLNLYYGYNNVLLFVVLLLFIRILCLKPSVWVSLICLGTVIGGRAIWQTTAYTLQQELPYSAVETVFSMEVDPLTLNIQENYISGKSLISASALEIEDLHVTFMYWKKDGEAEFPQQMLSEAVTQWQVSGQLVQPAFARNFDVFDYRDFLKNEKIAWQLEIESIEAVKQVKSEERDGLKRWRLIGHNLRARLTKPMRAYQAIPWVGLHNKLLFNLDSDAYRGYRDDLLTMGILHYFAISGFHLYYIRRLLRYIFLRGGATQEMTDWLVLFILLGYGWLIRWPVGVIRSMGAYYLYRITRRFQLPFSLTDLLGVIGILLLLVNPLYSQSVGFLLSFLMTYIIKFYSQQVPESGGRFKWRSTLEMTLACLVFSWPLVMMLSFEWNPVQFLVVILFGFVFDHGVMPAIFITTLLIYVPFPFSEGLLKWMSNVYDFIWRIGVPIDGIEAVEIVTGKPAYLTVLLLILVACLWLHWLKNRTWLAYSVLIICYGIVVFVGPYVDASTRLTILDVGQGDALLYQPAFSKQNWLIDTGGRAIWGERRFDSLTSFDMAYAEKDLVPALKALGVNRLTGVVITHPDMDHMGNLASLNAVFPIENLIVTPYIIQSDTWQEMQPYLNNIHQLKIIQPGELVDLNKLPLTLLSLTTTSKALYFAEDNSNDTSLAVLIKLGNEVFLNLGDLSSSSEQRLLGEVALPNISIIKLGHHGSNTSTSAELLSCLQPDLALISAGYDNRYGFPHSEVLDRLAKEAIPYLSTDEVGAIQLIYHPVWGYSVRTAIHK